MQLNDRDVTLANLTNRLNRLVEGSRTVVNVTVRREDVSMGYVRNVQDRLRASGLLRIRYQSRG